MGGSSSSSSSTQPSYWTGGTGTTQQQLLSGFTNYLTGPGRTSTGVYTAPTTLSSGEQASLDWMKKASASNPFLRLMLGSRITALEGKTKPASYSEKNNPRWQDYFEMAAEPYSGDLAAGTTDLQNKALSTIGGYKPSNLTDETRTLLSDTLTGKNRAGSIDAYKNSRMIGLNDQITAANQEANLGGMLPSTGRMAMTNDLRRRALANIGAETARLDESNANRQLSAVPQAMAVEQQPLETAKTQLAAGETERQIKQLGLDKQKEEYLRQLQAMGLPLETALKIMLWNPAMSSSSSTDQFDIANPFSFSF